MKTFPLIVIFATTLSACSATPPQPAANAMPTEAAHTADRNLIIFYDAQTGATPLLQAVQTIGASVLYRYQNFNALAIRLPENVSAEKAAADLAKIHGVLSVNTDSVAELH